MRTIRSPSAIAAIVRSSCGRSPSGILLDREV
jgi:hypothetical protein